MTIFLCKLKNWLLYNSFLYEAPISLIIILTMTYFYQKKNYEECEKAYIITFAACSCIHYIFYVIVYHLPPHPATWKILNTNLLKDSVKWSLYIIVDIVIWRFIMLFAHRFITNRKLLYAVLITLCSLYILFYGILFYKSDILGPLVYRISCLIPENVTY